MYFQKQSQCWGKSRKNRYTVLVMLFVFFCKIQYNKMIKLHNSNLFNWYITKLASVRCIRDCLTECSTLLTNGIDYLIWKLSTVPFKNSSRISKVLEVKGYTSQTESQIVVLCTGNRKLLQLSIIRKEMLPFIFCISSFLCI